jgi:hypothetical protein
MDGNERELVARLRLVFDQQSTQQAEKGVSGLKNKISSASVSLNGLNEGIKKMGAVSAAAIGAAGLLINKYQQTAGLGEATSRSWALGTRDLEMQYVRIGRTIEQSLLPYLNDAVDLTQKIANAAETNPNLVKGALQLAGVGTAAGAATRLAGPVAGLLTGGVASTAVATDWVNQLLTSLGVNQQIDQARAETRASRKKIYPGSIANPQERQLQVQLNQAIDQGDTQKIAQLTNEIKSLGATAQTTTGAVGVLPQEMQLYTQYLRQEEQAERERNLQVTRSTRDFYRQQAYDAADFYLQQSRSVRDFNYQLMTTEQDYYRDRMINARNFGIETTRMEEDHQRAMKRQQEDYQYGLWDILRSGDALAYMRAQHDYNLQRDRAEEDYQIQVRRRNEDYSLQLSDQETQFKIMRARQQVEFQRQQADQQQDFAIRRARAREQFAITQSDMQQDFDLQRQYRRQSFNDQLRDLSGFWTNMTSVSRYFQQTMVDDYLRLLSDAQRASDLITPNPNSGRAAGGPVLPHHTYTVGETGVELLQLGASGGYVYNPRATTRALSVMAANRGASQTGPKYVKADITVAMDGDNWTPALEARVSQKIVDVVGAAIGG